MSGLGFATEHVGNGQSSGSISWRVKWNQELVGTTTVLGTFLISGVGLVYLEALHGLLQRWGFSQGLDTSNPLLSSQRCLKQQFLLRLLCDSKLKIADLEVTPS